MNKKVDRLNGMYKLMDEWMDKSKNGLLDVCLDRKNPGEINKREHLEGQITSRHLFSCLVS